jgi:hypothetical protein
MSPSPKIAPKSNSPEDYQPLEGSERPRIPGATLISPVEASERVAFTLLLRQRPGSPDPHDFDHWENTPPGERKFLSVEEAMGTYGAAGDDLDAVVKFIESKGLTVRESDAGRRRLVVEGAASKINSAFGITLNQYRAPRRFFPRPVRTARGTGAQAPAITEHLHRGFEGPVHLPAELAGVVRAILGLDNRRVGGPAGTGKGDPPGADSLLPTTLAQRYNFPNTGAAGQTIGLFAAADEGAAYLPSDVTLFISKLPPGYNTPPHVTPIGLTVGAITYTNDTVPISSGFAGGAAYETTQDVQTSAAIGQGANINVYFTENSEAGWEAFLQRAVFPLPGDNPPSVLSASWVLYFQDDASVIGNPASSGSFANVVSGYLQSAAMRGITALIAIGDWGADNQVYDGHCHVGYPNSDPWFTACGGTILGTTEEWAWSDGNTGTAFDQGIYDATGGGVSATFAVPPYQAAAGVLPISKADGNSRRGVPDVAGMVGLTGFFMDGSGYTFTGTSCVAPLYAGLIATANAFLGHSVGFLNPTLYAHGPETCNDITVGNNDAGPPIPPLPAGTADSPFYTAGIGWDPCTGWGSINGRRLIAALAPAPVLVTAIASGGNFSACVGSFQDEILTINNTGFRLLLISLIDSSSPEFGAPDVASYPLAVSPGGSIDVVLRFKPDIAGTASAKIIILSNSLFGTHTIAVSGTAAAPRLVLAIADKGNFGNACVGSFVDEPLVVNNSGACGLSVTGLTSSSGDFLVPEILSFPLSIGAGDSVALPIRFAPASIGSKSATITVVSNDPGGPRSVDVSGIAPSGKLAVTGSTYFGGVKACCREERMISVCNVGECSLNVSSVAFKRKNRHWKLINNPFPATLHPGSCLAVVLRYFAAEKCPRCCELVITSDDPVTPVKTLEVLAYTVWNDCGCDCQKKPCAKQDCDPCGCDKGHDECCGDEGDEDENCGA